MRIAQHCVPQCSKLVVSLSARADAPDKEKTMAWTTPTLVEVCIGLEINGYLPAEF